jgi:hypothetical protein
VRDAPRENMRRRECAGTTERKRDHEERKECARTKKEQRYPLPHPQLHTGETSKQHPIAHARHTVGCIQRAREKKNTVTYRFSRAGRVRTRAWVYCTNSENRKEKEFSATSPLRRVRTLASRILGLLTTLEDDPFPLDPCVLIVSSLVCGCGSWCCVFKKILRK